MIWLNREVARCTVDVVFFPGICDRIVPCRMADHAVLGAVLGSVTLARVILLICQMALAAGKAATVRTLFPSEINIPMTFAAV